MSNQNEKHLANVRQLAYEMFVEYNAVAADYDLVPFVSQQEIEIVLLENMTELQVIKLLRDERGRSALSGSIATALVIDDIKASVILVEGIEGADNNILSLLEELGGEGPDGEATGQTKQTNTKKQTTH